MNVTRILNNPGQETGQTTMQDGLAKVSQDEPLKGECEFCHKPIEMGVYWKRFCDKTCRYKWHQQAAKLGRKVLKDQADAARDENKDS